MGGRKLGHTMMRVGLAVHGAGACMGDVTGATHKRRACNA
jgi:hypothetical protein